MAKLHPRIGDLRSCKVLRVIEVQRGIGKGADDEPYRIIKEYYSFDGELLARHDTWIDEEKCCD